MHYLCYYPIPLLTGFKSVLTACIFLPRFINCELSSKFSLLRCLSSDELLGLDPN